MDTLQSHYHNWYGVAFFVILYGAALLFLPFYRKMDKKPNGTYLAFVVAFAIEMHGIPFSMYVISWVLGRNLPEGVLWGHTLVSSIGHLGMYLGAALSVLGLVLILYSWRNIFKAYWPKDIGKGALVTTCIYRYVRHPQYAGLLLMSLGMILDWASLPILVLFPVMVAMYVRLAKREEADMFTEGALVFTALEADDADSAHPMTGCASDHQQSLRRGFNRSRRRVRRERDSATSTHIGGAIYTLGQCAARKSVRISGARRIPSFASKKPQGFSMP